MPDNMVDLVANFTGLEGDYLYITTVFISILVLYIFFVSLYSIVKKVGRL